MKELNVALYNSSLDDIEHMIECIEELRELNLNLRYTGREGFYSQTIGLCRKELDRLVKQHNKNYDDKVDNRTIFENTRKIIRKRRVYGS